MSDEEKEAIKGLEWSQQQMRLGNLPDYDQGHYADIRIVLNLIEKQSKEIEELKQEKEYLNCIIESDKDNYINKDKIKAKIEEYDDKGMTIKLGSRSAGKTFQYAVRNEVRKVLQSLLEKE